jgi:hypothetical protein
MRNGKAATKAERRKVATDNKRFRRHCRHCRGGDRLSHPAELGDRERACATCDSPNGVCRASAFVAPYLANAYRRHRRCGFHRHHLASAWNSFRKDYPHATINWPINSIRQSRQLGRQVEPPDMPRQICLGRLYQGGARSCSSVPTRKKLIMPMRRRP